MSGLVLGLKKGECFSIGGGTTIKVLSNSKGSCRLLINAPKDQKIERIKEDTEATIETK